MKKKMVAVWALAAVLWYGYDICPGSRGLGSIGEHLGLL